MRRFTLSCLQDLWDDFMSTIDISEVDLNNVRICQVCDIDYIAADNAIVYIEVYNVGSMSWENKKRFKVSRDVAELLDNKCFYAFQNKKFVPTDAVHSRAMNDYFGIKSSMALNGMSERSQVEYQAVMFRKRGRIVFLSKKMSGPFYNMYGMKSANGNGKERLSVVDIAKNIADRYGDKVSFFSDYIDTDSNDMEFSYMCRINGIDTADRYPLYMTMCDSMTSRKSIKIDISVKIDGYLYTLDSMEINHRHANSTQEVVDMIFDMLKTYENKCVNKNISASSIEDGCIKFIPKKAHDEFKAMLENPLCSVLKSAHDVLDSKIFNMKSKNHKTPDYDGGRKQYELALGQLIVC